MLRAAASIPECPAYRRRGPPPHTLVRRVRDAMGGRFMARRLGEYVSTVPRCGGIVGPAWPSSTGRSSSSAATTRASGRRCITTAARARPTGRSGREYRLPSPGTGFHFLGQQPFSFEAALAAASTLAPRIGPVVSIMPLSQRSSPRSRQPSREGPDLPGCRRRHSSRGDAADGRSPSGPRRHPPARSVQHPCRSNRVGGGANGSADEGSEPPPSPRWATGSKTLLLIDKRQTRLNTSLAAKYH